MNGTNRRSWAWGTTIKDQVEAALRSTIGVAGKRTDIGAIEDDLGGKM